MVSIPTIEGTVTLNHEWPVDVRAQAHEEGQPIVSLEVDTDLGTAVVALDLADLVRLIDSLDGFVGYYATIEEDEWTSR